MIALEPCPQCHRHVAVAETACPFCAAELAAVAPRVFGLGRLSRAAVFAGATLASACGGGKPKADTHTTTTPTADAGVPMKSVDAPTPTVEQVPDNTCCKPYGAPPARRRVV